MEANLSLKCSLNFIGSKYTQLEFINSTIRQHIDPEDKIFCDMFSGTGIVSRFFKPVAKSIIVNDFEDFAYILNRNYIGNSRLIKNGQATIDYLNNLTGVDGFIYENYAKDRKFFTENNARKIDAIKIEILKLKKQKQISLPAYYFYMTALLEASDKVANTASVYEAYLSKFKKSALKNIVLAPPYFEITKNKHKIYRQDANILIKKIQGDILYLDPPYNHRQYGSNYHLLNSIVSNKIFIPNGVAGKPPVYKRSKYCQSKHVKNSFEDLIKNANFEWIFLHYNDEGLLSIKDISDIMSKYGQYNFVKQSNLRYKADKDVNRTYKATSVDNYIHILQKI